MSVVVMEDGIDFLEESHALENELYGLIQLHMCFVHLLVSGVSWVWWKFAWYGLVGGELSGINRVVPRVVVQCLDVLGKKKGSIGRLWLLWESGR